MEVRRYEVRATRQAERQMRDIARYIAIDLKNPSAAEHLLDRFGKAMESFATWPGRVPLTEEEPWRGLGIRKAIVRNYLMYFWIDEESARVQVIAVVYGGRDRSRELGDMRLQE